MDVGGEAEVDISDKLEYSTKIPPDTVIVLRPWKDEETDVDTNDEAIDVEGTVFELELAVVETGRLSLLSSTIAELNAEEINESSEDEVSVVTSELTDSGADDGKLEVLHVELAVHHNEDIVYDVGELVTVSS